MTVMVRLDDRERDKREMLKFEKKNFDYGGVKHE